MTGVKAKIKVPRLEFQVNKELDKKMCLGFLSEQKGGIDFGEGIVRMHPELEGSRNLFGKAQDLFISEYIDGFYNNQRLQLTKTLAKIEQSWQKIAGDFFDEVDKIFMYHPWPDGKYICYLSIFDCNPRFLEDKTFQLFCQSSNPIYTICHELMHFMFYDYLKLKFPEKYAKLPDEKLWELSEVFNSTILFLPRFRTITQVHQKIVYPAHKELLASFERKWKRAQNIKGFFQSVL